MIYVSGSFASSGLLKEIKIARKIKNKVNCNVLSIIICYTDPSPPALIMSVGKNPDSVVLNITKGPGNVDHYVIFLNDKQSGQIQTLQNQNETIYRINGLTPNTFYQIYTTAVAGEYQSMPSPILIVQTGMFTNILCQSGILSEYIVI